MSATCVHLRHDLRVRKRASDDGLRSSITLQGYCDGIGLERELSVEEISEEMRSDLIEAYRHIFNGED